MTIQRNRGIGRGRRSARRGRTEERSAVRRPTWGRAPVLSALGAGGALALLAAGAGSAAAQGYTITDLGTMGGVSSSANAINNRGQVLGTITLTPDNTTWHAFLWQDGGMTDLGTLGGRQVSAVALNDVGQIVG